MKLQNQKQTPQKLTSHSNKNKILEQSFNKQFFCSFTFIESFCVGNFHFNQTPMRKQPQYLLTPSPVKKDLFSQLLGTQTKNISSLQQNQEIIQQQDALNDMSSLETQSIDEQESGFQNEGNWSEQNGTKKRKRKSTAQIKLLKLELDGEINWTKQKIIKMAQVTGLSQSQVYKWCWDQKKKEKKIKIDESRCALDKKKFIKKATNYRDEILKLQKQDKLNESQQKQNFKQVNRRTVTHLKLGANFVDEEQTQKKVNKRLVFF